MKNEYKFLKFIQEKNVVIKTLQFELDLDVYKKQKKPL